MHISYKAYCRKEGLEFVCMRCLGSYGPNEAKVPEDKVL